MERCDGWKLNSAVCRIIEKIIRHMLGNKYKNDVFLSVASKLLLHLRRNRYLVIGLVDEFDDMVILMDIL